jgi:hypothetical protein
MQNQQPDNRIRGALFTPPVIEAAPPEIQQVEQAEQGTASPAAEQPAAIQRRQRKPRQTKEQARTLQIVLPASLWVATKTEALRRGVSCSQLVARALAAYSPAIGSVNRPAA